jgi:hypothetical protein
MQVEQRARDNAIAFHSYITAHDTARAWKRFVATHVALCRELDLEVPEYVTKALERLGRMVPGDAA